MPAARGLLRAALVALAAAGVKAAPACKWAGNGASNGCGPSDGKKEEEEEREKRAFLFFWKLRGRAPPANPAPQNPQQRLLPPHSDRAPAPPKTRQPPPNHSKKTAFFVSLDLSPNEITAKVVQRLSAFSYACARHGNDTMGCAADAANFCAPLPDRLMPSGTVLADGSVIGPTAFASGQQHPASVCSYRQTLAARGMATLACPSSRGAQWAACFGLSDSRVACERKRAACVWDSLEFPDPSRPLPYAGSVRCSPREAADLLGSGDRGVAEFYAALAEASTFAGNFWGDDCATAQELRRGASACDGLSTARMCAANPLCTWASNGRASEGAAVGGSCALSAAANAAVFLLPPFSASTIAPGATTSARTAERVAAQVEFCGRLDTRDACEAEDGVLVEAPSVAAALVAAEEWQGQQQEPAVVVGGKRADEGPVIAAAMVAPDLDLPPAMVVVGSSVNVTYGQLRAAKEYNWYQAPDPPAAPLVGQSGGVLAALARAFGLGGGGGSRRR
jgi:hypothetical protein